MVRSRIASPRSNLTTVCGDTFAATANFLVLKPNPALAIRHCIGSTLSTLNGTTKGCYIEMLADRERCHANRLTRQVAPLTRPAMVRVFLTASGRNRWSTPRYAMLLTGGKVL